jgi:hypothetical protein
MAHFTTKTLVFIFEVRSPLQAQAAEELARRGWVFDPKTGRFQAAGGNEWSLEQWKAVAREGQESCHRTRTTAFRARICIRTIVSHPLMLV